MMQASRHIILANAAAVPALAGPPKSGAVDEVLNDRQLTAAEKRAILASWASDAHAVVDRPAMRRLEDGKVVKVDEILDALKSIDDDDRPTTGFGTLSHRRRRFARREPKVGIRWLSRIARRKNSDDDDPPPCPAAVGVPCRPSMVDARAPMPAWEPERRCRAPVAA